MVRTRDSEQLRDTRAVAYSRKDVMRSMHTTPAGRRGCQISDETPYSVDDVLFSNTIDVQGTRAVCSEQAAGRPKASNGAHL